MDLSGTITVYYINPKFKELLMSTLNERIASKLKTIEAPTGNLLFDAGTKDACTKIREVIQTPSDRAVDALMERPHYTAQNVAAYAEAYARWRVALIVCARDENDIDVTVEDVGNHLGELTLAEEDLATKQCLLFGGDSSYAPNTHEQLKLI